MRIASFEIDSREAWGIVLKTPHDNEDWVFEPQKTEDYIKATAALPGPWRGIAPSFMPEGWPSDIKDFLALGKEGMDRLYRLAAHLQEGLLHGDRVMFETTGYPISSVKLLCPVPRPGIVWGLVSNSPYTWRNTSRPIINFFPQAHQRSIGAIVPDGGIFCQFTGFNVELGVIIGEGGRDIAIANAYRHIAGYTVVIDSQVNDFYPLFDDRYETLDIEGHYGWYVGATASWMGKNADAHCVIGPYLTTPEEVGCPYDLLMYTEQNGKLRDRSHSAGISIGAERAIAFYSSFATLRPGDILHLGTVGTDGLPVNSHMYTGRGNTVGAEIERVGHVSAHMYDSGLNDWMTEKEKRPNGDFPQADESIQTNFSDAVRHFLLNGTDCIHRIEDWKPSMASNFFTCFANYVRAEELEHELPTRVPRVLNAPATAVTQEREVTLAKRAVSKLFVSVELAFIVKKLACKVLEEKAEEYILGYAPMVSVTDYTFAEEVIEPASPQERGLPNVYGRWGDGYNMIGVLQETVPGEAKTQLCINGVPCAAGNLSEYHVNAAKTLSFISQVVTLFPGDVITLGRLAERAEIQADVKAFAVDAVIDGFPALRCFVRRYQTGTEG